MPKGKYFHWHMQGKRNSNYGCGKVKCKCSTCSESFFVYPYRIKDGVKYCSQKCVGAARKGTGKGYTTSTINGKQRRDHLIIAEKTLGRKLKKGECVHHLNGNKADNRNCNLLICTNSYHTWLENKMAHLYKQEHFGGVI